MNAVALITGASRGLGRGIALELARAGGCHLILNYARDEASARQTAKDCGELARAQGHSLQAEICQADIALAGDRSRLIDFARSTFGRLDVLVNNAGVAPAQRVDLLETSEESFDRVLGINLRGPFCLSQMAARWRLELTRSNLPSYSPKIITISSISAYTASVNRGEYCIAKAGLGMLTSLFATRLAEYGIQVFEIRPGVMATDMTAAVKSKYDQMIAQGLTPIARWGEPSDVGRAVVAIYQNLLPFSTGEVINVDGGFHLRRL